MYQSSYSRCLLGSVALVGTMFIAALPAHADRLGEALANRDLTPHILPSFDSDWQWGLYGAISGDGRASSDEITESTAALAAGFDLAYASRDCRWVGLAGDVQGYADRDGSGLATTESFTFCVPLPIHLPEFTIRHERELRPQLSAPPIVRASR
ncbi:MAG: hypothetical protein AAGC55_10715, partial [Myxococcota bacterium]